jgi:HAE1 family hydrophobic/amphiphilic exporter-1
MGTGKNFFAMMQGKTGSHFIAGRINLIKKELRPNMPAGKIREQIREVLKEIPGIRINFYIQSMGSSQDSPVQVEVRGTDLKDSQDIAKQVQAIMVRDFKDELKDVLLSRKEGTEEVIVKINRLKAATMGFNVSMIANTIKNNFLGVTASRYRFKGDEIDILVRLTENQRLSQKDLENVILKSPLGFSVPISQVVNIEKGVSPVKIERKAQDRVIYIKANTAPGIGVGNVVDKLKMTVSSEVVLPDGITLIYGGSYQDMQESFGDLGTMFLLAIALIYMVMASQFESFLNPFLILFAIPLSLIGVVWILVFTVTEFNVVTFIGVIILAGIVVNNGIILVDYIRQLREVHGMELFESIIKAGRTRLRPIIMTTATTVIGMIPMAVSTGPGSETSAPMAIAVVGGLTVSTMLTLVFIPVIYSIFEGRLIKRRKRKIAKAKTQPLKYGV